MITSFVDQLRLERRHKKRIPRTDNSMAIALHTPTRPIFGESKVANGKRTSHIETRLKSDGIIVSPVPLRTPVATIEAANRGSAKASIRKTLTPSI